VDIRVGRRTGLPRYRGRLATGLSIFAQQLMQATGHE